ncbi:MAG TPA: protein kinase [Kofleriaceae bacterium]|nr:protein kinase [Kofleriaceae bacterium]
MAFNSNPSVDELVAAGRYADAARVAADTGEAARAAQLYERIWDFAAAARSARAAGDLPRALRNAIDSHDEQLVRETADALGASGDQGRRAALDVFAARRRFHEAALLAEELGDRERAADLHLSCHRDLDAARILAELGRDREAGRLYERVIEQAGSPDEVEEAHLRLGLLLARRLQHEAAVRHLQEAAREPRTRVEARRALVVELASLGLRDAARDVLLAARADDASLPATVDEFVQAHAPVRRPASQATGAEPADLVAGRYRLDRLLGQGATGRVYRASDEVSGRVVALKILSGGYARGSPPYERFAREAQVARSLRHPNVVEVHDFSADFGWLVMEYMVGDSLDRRIERRMGVGAVRRLVADVLSGLEAAHRRGVIHRDIKPANIFFDARGTAKLGDFGVAHLLDLGQTQTGGLIGTLAYMSPEQITGAPLTIAADLYSLGVTLFECLTGRLPFLGPDFVAQHLGEPPPAPSQVASGLAPGWDAVLERLLAKDPDARHASSDELRRAIAAVEPGSDTGPLPLSLPRAPAARMRSTAELATARSGAMPAVQGAEEPRYRFETPLGRTPISTLSRAVDSALDRSVIVERYEEGALDETTERRLLALAKSGGSFLQRVLSFDRQAAVVVYEAPAGMPIGERPPGEPPLDPLRAARVLRRLARALAPLHESQSVHGALGPTTVVMDELDHPTVLASGLGPATAGSAPPDDVAALVDLVAGLAGAESRTVDGLIAAMTPDLSHPERAALRALPASDSGEALHVLADALELALLKTASRRQRSSR